MKKSMLVGLGVGLVVACAPVKKSYSPVDNKIADKIFPTSTKATQTEIAKAFPSSDYVNLAKNSGDLQKYIRAASLTVTASGKDESMLSVDLGLLVSNDEGKTVAETSFLQMLVQNDGRNEASVAKSASIGDGNLVAQIKVVDNRNKVLAIVTRNIAGKREIVGLVFTRRTDVNATEEYALIHQDGSASPVTINEFHKNAGSKKAGALSQADQALADAQQVPPAAAGGAPAPIVTGGGATGGGSTSDVGEVGDPAAAPATSDAVPAPAVAPQARAVEPTAVPDFQSYDAAALQAEAAQAQADVKAIKDEQPADQPKVAMSEKMHSATVADQKVAEREAGRRWWERAWRAVFPPQGTVTRSEVTPESDKEKNKDAQFAAKANQRTQAFQKATLGSTTLVGPANKRGVEQQVQPQQQAAQVDPSKQTKTE